MGKNFKIMLTGLISVLILGIGLFLFLKQGSEATSASKQSNDKKQETKDTLGTPEKTSKNLIVLIGDGMGMPQITLTRIYGEKYEDIKKLSLDEHLVGMNSTYAENSPDSEESGIVTDSAASGTAFATGNKTYNGAIAVTNEAVAKPYASVIEAARDAGKSTGLISTARITHATPAVYATHVRDRGNENAIAAQYLDSGVDILFGGGERHFVKDEKSAKFGESKREDGRDLISEFKEKGYAVVYDKKDLQAANGKQIIGLFGDSHVPYNLDRKGDKIPTLKEQLEKAVSTLEQNDKGFVIMLEGGRIDHAGHANDLHGVAQETLEFDEAFRFAIDYAKKDGNTSVIATADHETGGLTIGSQNIYDAYFDVFKNVNASSEIIGKELEEAKTEAEIKEIVKKYTKIDDLTDDEVKLIMSGNLADGSPSSYKREGSFNTVISKRSLLGWTGHGHTGVDVGVYGIGPAAELLRGFTDNTDFAKAGAKALGLDLDKATSALQKKYLYPKYQLTKDETFVFPLKDLQEHLGYKLNKKGDDFELAGKGEAIKIKKDSKDVKIGEKSYPVLVDQNELYASVEVLEHIAKDTFKWDELSERIIKE